SCSVWLTGFRSSIITYFRSKTVVGREDLDHWWVEPSWLRHALRRATDCPHNARMRAAPAEIAGQRLPDDTLVRSRIPPQQRRRLHDHAGDAVAALRRLLVEKRLLQWMEVVRRAESFQR